MRALHISAGGKGKRMSEITNSAKGNLPKHLLPLPSENKTILGEIVANAQQHFDRVQVWCSIDNCVPVALEILPKKGVSLRIDSHMTGPLGPLIRESVEFKRRTYGCAGDFYCNFDWEKFESFHNASGFPISILIAKSIPVPKGARFVLNEENKRIEMWERVQFTKADHYINIGAYIIDPVVDVIRLLEGIKYHKEDVFFDIFIPKGLIVGYNPGNIGYNINVPLVYEELVRSLIKHNSQVKRE